MNKTPNYIDGITTQIAVLKYLKINIQNLNNNAMPANSKGAVKQVKCLINIDNDSYKYSSGTERYNYEDKAFIHYEWTEIQPGV